MGCYLKNGIRRGVQNWATGSQMFGPEALDYLGTRRRLVTQRHLSGDPRELVHDFLWKALGICRKWNNRNDARHLPMAGYRVFSAASLAQTADPRDGLLRCRDAFERRDMPEPQTLERWER